MSLRNHDWRQVLKVLNKFGFQFTRQRGSHIILKKEGKTISVPRHSPIAMVTLRQILLEAEISEQDFLDNL
ncbi:MAG: type II toxin-antitoxin system HicA family toxin [Nitrosopumilaceae archaeon]